MWLNIVAAWLALNAAVVTVALLSRLFGHDRGRAPLTGPVKRPPTRALPPPLPAPTRARPVGRHPARHARHQPVRETRSGEPPAG